jgi:flagellar basal-body rod modification protein FlgD
MTIPMVTSSISPAQTKAAQSTSDSGMPGVDNGEFMALLLTQMRNQNPLEPMDDNQMIAQMAQLNSLSELQKINANLEALLGLFQEGTGGNG